MLILNINVVFQIPSSWALLPLIFSSTLARVRPLLSGMEKTAHIRAKQEVEA